ncbi:MAG: hypothetical protein KGI50_03030 [Patescibacteria group bacterium]|nr:hypothetical protein [Patescibacteria group bacterium]MDE2438266.1 hypothetical protein [Patescibacteria group bacterium]
MRRVPVFKILMRIVVSAGSGVALWFLSAGFAYAHEAYVVNRDYFWQQLAAPVSAQAWEALKNKVDLHITLQVVGGFLVVLFLNAWFRRTRLGMRVHHAFEHLAPYGSLFVRSAIAIAFFYSALSWSFLGPELLLRQMPVPVLLRALLFVSSILIAVGWYTEIAAFITLIIFLIGWRTFGMYMVTYLNYFGEIVALLLFGTRTWSFDRVLRGTHVFFESWKRYETTIVRVCYGIALMYAALVVKFLHPALTIHVVTTWHLTQFHWLFPSDPVLVTLGAGLAEFAIGLFIFLGFELRLTVLISLFYITLSLIYFRELVWPHVLLYGISLNLLVQPERFTLDRLFFRKK